MTDTAKWTKGPTFSGPTGKTMRDDYSQPYVVAVKSGRQLICGCFGDIPGGDAEAKANADLIAEAFNAHAETGLTPRQLVEQRGELLKALRCAVNVDLPLIGSPTDDQLVSYWADEKEQGRGCADDMIFIMQTLLKVEAKP